MLRRHLLDWPLPRLGALQLALTAAVMLAATLLVWENHQQVLVQHQHSVEGVEEVNRQIQRTLTEQIPNYLLLQRIATTAQAFEYEFTLAVLDSERGDGPLQALQARLKQFQQELKALPAERMAIGVSRKQLLESVGILLGIAREFGRGSSNERQQLLRDTAAPIGRIRELAVEVERRLAEESTALTARVGAQIDRERGHIAEAQALFTTLNYALLFVFGAALALILLLQGFISRILQARLTRLGNYAGAIAQGDFSASPVLPVADDTGRLADSMQAMAANLQTTLARLEATAQAAEEARRAAEAANQAKSVFLANMSHELRTPLNAILGYAQLLGRDHSLGEGQRHSMQIIRRSGDHLLTLINDILDLSKVEAGRIELHLEDFRFGELIRDLTDMFSVRARQKEIAFRYQPLTELPEALRGDVQRLRQILINLLGNAVKFTDQGAVTVRLAWRDGWLEAEIEDSGIGIAEAELPHIFSPFRQVGDHYHHTEGAGLGLSISAKLVEMMGGSLEASSRLGEGSRFRLRLPLAEATAPVAEAPVDDAEEIVGYRPPPGRDRPYRILVADDKPTNHEVLEALLTPLGFVLKVVENGRDAVDAARSGRPDLILMDLVMPVLDGVQATRKLRSEAEFATLPIIAVSASAFGHQRKECLEAGCNAFVAKPYKLDALLHCLEQWLPLEWVRDGEAKATATAAPALEAAPSPAQARALHDLAMRGDLAGIGEYLRQLERENPGLAALTARLRQRMEEYDDQGIIELVGPYLE